MSDALPELIQFAYSHYNEKARWAFDWKGVPHTRRDLLPGPHMAQVARIAKASTVPIAKFGDEHVQGSNLIIDELERRYPAKPLYPAGPAERDRALALQARFDAELGPPVRGALFSFLLDERDYLVSMFAYGRTGLARAAYRRSVPLIAPVMKRSMGIATQAAVDAAFAQTEQMLAFIAAEAKDGYLVGDSFTVADLTAAALLAPCANPPDCCMTQPEPATDGVRRWRARWAGHPAIAYALRMYRDHRPASQQVR